MSIQLEAISRINSLKSAIETTTGETYNNLTDAVQALKNGYDASTEEQYEVFEAAHDWATGIIIKDQSFSQFYPIINVEVSGLPENADVKRVEIIYNNTAYALEDLYLLEGKDVWFCYYKGLSVVNAQQCERLIASLYYKGAPESGQNSLYEGVINETLDDSVGIRVYYTVK